MYLSSILDNTDTSQFWAGGLAAALCARGRGLPLLSYVLGDLYSKSRLEIVL